MGNYRDAQIDLRRSPGADVHHVETLSGQAVEYREYMDSAKVRVRVGYWRPR
jgi:hypothetical protein